MSRAKTAAGRALREEHMRRCVAVLGAEELLARVVAARAEWSDPLAEAVLEAALQARMVRRRRETVEEAQQRAARNTAHRTLRRCWLWRAAEVAPPRDGPRGRGGRWRP